MIQYLQRNQLDDFKYDACISKAYNSKIYAYSWYLDCVCDDWDVLVKDDYEAVMPLPKRKKFGIHYVYLPPWTQQLGVFSRNRIENKLINYFINSIPKKFGFINTHLNAANPFQSNDSITRSNYELLLHKEYNEIIKGYSKGRKSSISKAKKYSLQIVEDYNYLEIKKLFQDNIGNQLTIKKSDYDRLDKLLQITTTKNYIKSIAILKGDMLVGGAFFLIDKPRITYLISAVNKLGRETQAMSLLIDEMIKKFSNSQYILDFEGSEIEELAFFFKSYGAINNVYTEIKIYRNNIVKLCISIIEFIKKHT